MVQLAGDEAERGEVEHFGERGEQRIGTEDPKHIEAAEGIEGDEAWGGGRGGDGSAHTGWVPISRGQAVQAVNAGVV